MNDATLWWVIGIAVLAVIALAAGIAAKRSRRGSQQDDRRRPEAPVGPPAEPATVAPTPAVAAPTAPIAPPTAPVLTSPAPAAPPRPVAAPAPVRPAPASPTHEPVPVTVVPTPARPSSRVVERVLAVEAADEDSWARATPLPISPVQASAMALLVAPVTADRGRLLVHFRSGEAMRLARAEVGAAEALASAGADAVRDGQAADVSAPLPVQWLDSVAASSLAANVVAAIATAGDLGALADECRDLKAAVAALPAKPVGPAELRLKPLLQDASRYVREARDNYPSVIAKEAFRERIGSAFATALDVWRDQLARAASFDARSEPLLAAPRFGEVQVEAAGALWREVGEWQRLLELSARLLAVLHVLRVSVGDAAAPGAGDAIVSSATSLRAIADENAEAAARLASCEAAAKGDPYVGRGEFEAQRTALRTLLARPWRDAVEQAVGRLERAAAVAAPDPAGAIVIALAGSSCEVRLAAG